MEPLAKSINNYFEIGQEDAEKVARLFRPEKIERNEFHTKEGSRSGKLSFIHSGFLRIYKQTPDKEVTQWVSSPGEFTTELGSLMFDQPSRWNIQALTDCELYSLDSSSYQQIKNEIENWSEIEKLFLAKCFVTIEDRVFGFLSMTAEERYAYLSEVKPELIKNVPLQYIASMLGMTPETLSRIRRKIVS